MLPGKETEPPLEFRKDHELSPSEDPLETADARSHGVVGELGHRLRGSTLLGGLSSSVVVQSSLSTAKGLFPLSEELGLSDL